MDHRSTDETVEGTVTVVEVKNVDLRQEMQRSIVRQAEAEREHHTKVTHPEGEFETSQRLANAADVIGLNPVALQLCYLQTLVDIAAEKNSTTIFPPPVDTIATSTSGSALSEGSDRIDGRRKDRGEFFHRDIDERLEIAELQRDGTDRSRQLHRRGGGRLRFRLQGQ